jgi:hypothetical protein
MGVLVVGSGAVGFTDTYSDIDLAVIVERAEEVKPAFDDWGKSIAEMFAVLSCVPVQRAPNIFLYAMLLGGFLELDISFQCLDDLTARRARWRVAWDRSGRIDEIMRVSWDTHPEPDRAGFYHQYMEGTWHYVNHVGLSAARGQLWRAISDLELIRARVIELAGLRGGHETRRFREADDLPPGLLSALETTLVVRVDAAEILRALRSVVMLFIDEARALAATLEGDVPPVPDALLVALVELWEAQVGNKSDPDAAG